MNYNNNINCNILCWNIRGINSAQKWLALSEKISESACSIICLQETKREHFDHSYIRKFCPRRFDKFIFHPSNGTSGGIIIIWNSSILTGSLIENLPYAITVQFV
jgi:exonuclease III